MPHVAGSFDPIIVIIWVPLLEPRMNTDTVQIPDKFRIRDAPIEHVYIPLIPVTIVDWFR